MLNEKRKEAIVWCYAGKCCCAQGNAGSQGKLRRGGMTKGGLFRCEEGRGRRQMHRRIGSIEASVGGEGDAVGAVGH